MVSGDAVAGSLLDEQHNMGAGGEETGAMGTPWSAWGSGLGGGRGAAPMVLVAVIRCGRRMVRGCGSGCQRRHLVTE